MTKPLLAGRYELIMSRWWGQNMTCVQSLQLITNSCTSPMLRQGCQKAPNRADWPQMGHIWDFFRSEYPEHTYTQKQSSLLFISKNVLYRLRLSARSHNFTVTSASQTTVDLLYRCLVNVVQDYLTIGDAFQLISQFRQIDQFHSHCYYL